MRRKAFKPNTDPSLISDPVPAGNPQMFTEDYKYRPGSGTPDPVPARPAAAAEDIQSFRPLYVENDGSYAGPDPVPAVSYYEGE